MPLDLSNCTFTGPALPEPFVRLDLEKELRDLLPKQTGDEGREAQQSWDSYRRRLRELVSQGGPLRVRHCVIEPLAARLGYAPAEPASEIATREGSEAGGWLLKNGDGHLRAWTTALGEDLDAPSRRGHAYRFSHLRIAQRVLLATGERVGLLTNGVELRILISDPTRTDSEIEIPLESHWKRARDIPDSYRLVLALCSPAGLAALPGLIDKARLKQTGVTKELRRQAREAVELFVQDLLDNPENLDALRDFGFLISDCGLKADQIENQKSKIKNLSKQLWHEGLINIFRLLFVLKMESVADPARAFSFASSTLWRNTYSPSVALAPIVRAVLDKGTPSGEYLEQALRSLFRMFTEGLACSEINVKPLGGALFGSDATPLISKLAWGERAVAHLLDRLLWTPLRRGGEGRERVHYGALTVQDLGRVYEALIELEPGIAGEPMCRLRRRKLEVVVPLAQGEKYRKVEKLTTDDTDNTDAADDPSDESDLSDDEETTGCGKKTPIDWIEEIPAGRFYLRVGLGRKASGSYYTPDSFVKFLVQETLGPLCAERSPRDDPQPGRILDIKVADIAMGSGHFLFEACDFLGEKLYEACRLCDELAMKEEGARDQGPGARGQGSGAGGKYSDSRPPTPDPRPLAPDWRARVQALPDPNDELLAYLPSRAPEDGNIGLSSAKALALCRRLVAVHCLYGVDLNPLAVELAKLSLWIETHAEGYPLTFLDHRFVVGNSLTGPFFEHLATYPGSREPMDDLFTQGLKERLAGTLRDALRDVRELEATVGINLGEIKAKEMAKARMDALLEPFKLLARAWSGGVMLGPKACDDPAYAALAKAVAEGTDPSTVITQRPSLGNMIATGSQTLAFDLVFPDVFYRKGNISQRAGFDVLIGNPPWDQLELAEDEFWAHYDMEVVAARDHRQRKLIIHRLTEASDRASAWQQYANTTEGMLRLTTFLYQYQTASVGENRTRGRPDMWRLFAERSSQMVQSKGFIGLVVPASFHGNEGATGIRRLYLDHLSLACCFSFENRRALFDIHRSFKFAILVARKPGPTKEVACGFYLHDDAWLFSDRLSDDRHLLVSMNDIRRLGGAHVLFLEARNRPSYELAKSMRSSSVRTWTEHLRENGMSFSNGIECHRRPDATYAARNNYFLDVWLKHGHSPTVIMEGIPLADGKHINQFSLQSQYPIHDFGLLLRIVQSSHWSESLPFYRLGLRYVAASTNERTVITSLLPPLVGFTNGIIGETSPGRRPNSMALLSIAVLNSYCFDYQVRQQATTHINRFVLAPVGVPTLTGRGALLAHGSLRLLESSDGFGALWTEQLGDEWREYRGEGLDRATAHLLPESPSPTPDPRTPIPVHTWPVLEGNDARWAVRAAVDAVVADAYGLTREQYAHVLSTFSHKSYPKAPEFCLARFDELKSIGLDAFTKKHDPYWDIPLNENLPKPVIKLPGVGDQGAGAGKEGAGKKRRGRKKAPGVVKEQSGDYGPLFGGRREI